VLGPTTYTFTPDAGQCGTTATMTINVTTQVTPTFTQIGPLCQRSEERCRELLLKPSQVHGLLL
jgi:hypothetical protein